jgi:hypothetical protein
VSYKNDASRAAAVAAASKRKKVANLRESFIESKEWNPTEKTNVGWLGSTFSL